jgi:predicted NAD/FAD-binding protein
MLSDILRFNREAVEDDSVTDETTVSDYLARRRYSPEFAEHYLLPMGAAIWSCPLGTFANFPIKFIVEFYRNHGLLSVRNRPTWRVIEGGSRTYVTKMVERVVAISNSLRGSTTHRNSSELLSPSYTQGHSPAEGNGKSHRNPIWLNTPIEEVRRTPDDVTVTPRNRPPEKFDHVVFGCHSDQALRMLADATPVERDVLSEFPYGRNVAVLHTDPRVLPKRRRAWASWNYHISGRPSDVTSQSASVTYYMNMLQHIRSRHTFNVSLNSDEQIDPRKVLRRIEYHHPIFTVRRAAAQARHRELINVKRTSFCGAYWGNGFHEDGVVSALRVCEALVPKESPA